MAHDGRDAYPTTGDEHVAGARRLADALLVYAELRLVQAELDRLVELRFTAGLSGREAGAYRDALDAERTLLRRLDQLSDPSTSAGLS